MIIEPGNPIQAHFGRYTTMLYVVIATLAVGLLFGILAVGTLSPADRLLLVRYVDQFVRREAAAPTWHGIFRPALVNNLKLLGLVYLLGISVAGVPFVLFIVFFRGFIVGFAVAFFVEVLHWQGVWLSTATIGLQNVFLIPALVIVSAVALGFSWDLISVSARASGPTIAQRFAYFTGLAVAMAAVFVVATALEAYAAPLLVHLFG